MHASRIRYALDLKSHAEKNYLEQSLEPEHFVEFQTEQNALFTALVEYYGTVVVFVFLFDHIDLKSTINS